MIYTTFIIFLQKKKKIVYIKFLPKLVTVYSKIKAEFDYKNNHRCSKLTNFQLDIINKIHYKILVVILYTSLELRLKKV